MDEEQKNKYMERYKHAKEAGVKFYPDVVFKDLLVIFAIFLLLVGLAIFIGVKAEPPADPSDSSYIPRPEWYFLFLFQMLKYFPGRLEWLGTAIIPVIAVLVLFLLPFLDRNPFRYWKKRVMAIIIMIIMVISIVILSIIAAVTTPPQIDGEIATTLSDQIAAGQDLFSLECVACHGPNGEGGEIEGVEGLEGKVIKSISSKDELYTREDQTLFNIIEYGQPDLGMIPFGKAFGGELSRGDIQAIVTFIRYTWDDRVELPAAAALSGAIPTLAPGQVPSYYINIQPIFKRYCISCHRDGKSNQNYTMGSYEEVMTFGDHAPNIKPGDLNSNMILMLHRQEIDAGGPMPPAKALPADLIAIIELWVQMGAPNTAEEAASLASPQEITPDLVITITPVP